MKTTGNTILITGGTSGLGLGLALRWHAAGNTVIIAGRRADLLEQIVAENPGLESLVLDVTDSASIAAAFTAVTTEHPELNVLVNMAGIMLPENLLDPAFLEVSRRTIATNLTAPIEMIATFAPFLTTQNDAVIMNVSSGLAFVPLPLTPSYNATKAAIHSFSESLRVQLASTSVRVLELIPPAVQTPLMGQENDERAMPLEAFLSEVMQILEEQPDVEQVTVENVKFLRNAESDGTYTTVLEMLSGH